jgi:hypothetical protein
MAQKNLHIQAAANLKKHLAKKAKKQQRNNKGKMDFIVMLDSSGAPLQKKTRSCQSLFS